MQHTDILGRSEGGTDARPVPLSEPEEHEKILLDCANYLRTRPRRLEGARQAFVREQDFGMFTNFLASHLPLERKRQMNVATSFDSFLGLLKCFNFF